jgi:hypothetical protein
VHYLPIATHGERDFDVLNQTAASPKQDRPLSARGIQRHGREAGRGANLPIGAVQHAPVAAEPSNLTEGAGAPNPLTSMRTSRRTFPQKAETLPNGCIIWTGRVDRHGYGTRNGKLAHRVAYERAVGPIPDGKLVCHTCDNRRCINPQHLWLGTAEENAIDSSAKGRNCQQGKTHCPQGHEYTPENTRFAVVVRRHCRACRTTAHKMPFLPNLPAWANNDEGRRILARIVAARPAKHIIDNGCSAFGGEEYRGRAVNDLRQLFDVFYLDRIDWAHRAGFDTLEYHKRRAAVLAYAKDHGPDALIERVLKAAA